MVAIAEEVKLQTFALDHADIGDIIDIDGGEIRLAGDGTKACKLRTVETHPVIVLLMAVLESLEHFGGIILTVSRCTA